MAWIESHQELGRHPKTRTLSRRLGISAVQAVGHLHFLWWWALDFARDGTLTDIEPCDIAEGAGWDDDPEAFIAALVEAGFLNTDGDELTIHDWDDYAGRYQRQREQNLARQRRHRGQAQPTPPDSNPEPAVDPVTQLSRVTSRVTNGATGPNRTKQDLTEHDMTEQDLNSKRSNGAKAPTKATDKSPPQEKPEEYGGLSPAEVFYLEIMELKRFSKPKAQRKAIREIEQKFGFELFRRAAVWTANKGKSDINTIASCAATMAKGEKGGSKNETSGRTTGRVAPDQAAPGKYDHFG